LTSRLRAPRPEHLDPVSDDFDLERFVDAQNSGGIFERVGIELRNGRKESHWMWFIFPQIAGLGHSAMAQRYAISGLEEARAYLYHRVLGPRLMDCAQVLTELPDRDPVAIFGTIDAQKLHSSMTLFAEADPLQSVFNDVIKQYFEGVGDKATISRL
jgi:uncharacterized protein (DUF1810 family)